MPQSPGNPSPETSPDFGANEWLVEEMFEQYQRDPGSVAPEWVRFFADNGTSGSNGSGAAPAPDSQQAPDQKPEKKPEKKPAQQPEQKSGSEQADPDPERRKKSGASQDSGSAEARPVAKPRPAAQADEPAKGTDKPVAKDPAPPARSEAKDEPTLTVLRGIPAATVKNMDASLSVPTATSVRSVPVKLLWDNRTVINNHLAR
ncbi:MAG TPA: multifunctional oxoglutarate decarboxylase/oxoglutarate dehydrogenase thiamine pyrophosphate-binding subunit/dihydrolipoyllysine-residue succinyltransferase subunit, partial [Nocardioides sp.]|nr:multifunctional oxoglutarate decarboxylase/oxoglutarate dehydrogenase thiamine pyrophosphate-binding subunit/dihydrolipoyllysine-residue succinyltransferase subunit [Nocardioides sp.]